MNKNQFCYNEIIVVVGESDELLESGLLFGNPFRYRFAAFATSSLQYFAHIRRYAAGHAHIIRLSIGDGLLMHRRACRKTANRLKSKDLPLTSIQKRSCLSSSIFTCLKWFFSIDPSGCGNDGIDLPLSGDIILFESKSINQISSGNLPTENGGVDSKFELHSCFKKFLKNAREIDNYVKCFFSKKKLTGTPTTYGVGLSSS